VFAALNDELVLVLADSAFQTQNNLLRGLGLLVEDGLCLTTITSLLTIVTALSLSKERGLASLVLGDLVHRVTTALFASAQRTTGLRNVHLQRNRRSEDCPVHNTNGFFEKIHPKQWIDSKGMDGACEEKRTGSVLPFRIVARSLTGVGAIQIDSGLWPHYYFYFSLPSLDIAVPQNQF
jgi:hypothetical protein